jgi:hypothetical protein
MRMGTCTLTASAGSALGSEALSEPGCVRALVDDTAPGGMVDAVLGVETVLAVETVLTSVAPIADDTVDAEEPAERDPAERTPGVEVESMPPGDRVSPTTVTTKAATTRTTTAGVRLLRLWMVVRLILRRPVRSFARGPF